MTLAAGRLARAGDPALRSLARTLRSTAFGRHGPGEPEWIERIEARRRSLAADDKRISAEYVKGPDPATGRGVRSEEDIQLGIGVAFMSITSLWGRFLLKLVHERAPESVLELGTAFGISTAYQAAALELNGRGTLTTLDAAADWGRVAQEGLEELGLEGRVDRRVGWIDETLPAALADRAPIDFAYVDAEHEAEPTIGYFEAILPHLSAGSFVVFDDIAFGPGMRSAWRAIRRHPRVSVSLNLGRMGVIALPAEG
jgi:predicted O-methyltransferase YrrM